MKKLSSLKKTLGTALLTCPLLALPVKTAVAQEGIKLDAVRNDLLKASIAKTSGNGTLPADKDLSASDLEKADKRLKDAEARMEAQLQPAAAAPSAAKAMLADKAETAQKPAVSGNTVSVPKNFDIDKINEQPKSQVSASTEQALSAAKEQLAAMKSNPMPLEIKALPNEELVRRNTQLEQDLQNANARINTLLKDLDDSRNRLMIAETQVERLSSIIEQRNGGKIPSAPAVAARQNAPAAIAARIPGKQQSDAASDMQIATVIVDKAHLRTGPGKDNSPLMAVPKGTRLAVETRNGDWYRVIAPTGIRAWVASDVVAFGIGGKDGFNQASRVRGFSSSLE